MERDGLKMPTMSKKDADAYDRLLDAAARLADIIASGGLEMDEDLLEELTIFLAEHGMVVSRILKNLRLVWP
jgi:dsDNA-binding SOS-regulon protein